MQQLAAGQKIRWSSNIDNITDEDFYLTGNILEVDEQNKVCHVISSDSIYSVEFDDIIN